MAPFCSNGAIGENSMHVVVLSQVFVERQRNKQILPSAILSFSSHTDIAIVLMKGNENRYPVIPVQTRELIGIFHLMGRRFDY